MRLRLEASSSATRTEVGLAVWIIRLRIPAAIAASPCWLRNVWARSSSMASMASSFPWLHRPNVGASGKPGAVQRADAPWPGPGASAGSGPSAVGRAAPPLGRAAYQAAVRSARVPPDWSTRRTAARAGPGPARRSRPRTWPASSALKAPLPRRGDTRLPSSTPASPCWR